MPETESDIERFIEENFPQIQTHGGGFLIQSMDSSSGEITIELNGYCTECSLSPMTEKALENRLVENFNSIQSVSVLA